DCVVIAVVLLALIAVESAVRAVVMVVSIGVIEFNALVKMVVACVCWPVVRVRKWVRKLTSRATIVATSGVLPEPLLSSPWSCPRRGDLCANMKDADKTATAAAFVKSLFMGTSLGFASHA